MTEEYQVGVFSDISDSSEDEVDSHDSSSSSGSDNEEADNTWNDVYQKPTQAFQRSPVIVNPELGIRLNSSPLEALQSLITTEMVHNVSSETNRYVSQVQRTKPNLFSKWKEVTDDELWNFLALNLAMGITQKPAVKDYWTTNEVLTSPFFSKIMSRNRFEQILAALHFVDNETAENQKRFEKLGQFFPTLLQNFRKSVFPGEYLCLDETLMGFKGRLSFKQYNPQKRRRFGIKFFVLVDCCTKVVLDMLPYEGKTTEVCSNLICELGFGGAAVMKLLENHLENHHKVVVDNYFNSARLAQRLLNLETFVLGTVRKNRKDMPKMTGKLKKGEIQVFLKGQLVVERWQDRREAVMLNTFIPHSMAISPSTNPVNTRLKPASVLLYNKTMGAVDEMDKSISIYSNTRKTYKWYKKVFFFPLDVSVYNAFRILSAIQEKPITHKNFILRLITEIIEKFPINRTSRGRPRTNPPVPSNSVQNNQHFPVRVGKTPLGKASKADCVECRKMGRRRTQTQFKCKVCNVRLCIQEGLSCFESFHSKDKRKRKRREEQEIEASSFLTGNSSETMMDLTEESAALIEASNTENFLHESLNIVAENDVTEENFSEIDSDISSVLTIYDF